MKTNIINTLIIAIILIAGWSVFTIIQDFNTSSSGNYPNYSVISKGKQYLPKAPENYSKQHNYPVYKEQQQGVARSTINNNIPAIGSKNDLVDASTLKKNNSSILISMTKGFLKALMGHNDKLSGNQSQNFFIEIPVGDGFYLLLMMSIIYSLIKFRKIIKLYVSSQIVRQP